jgi:hypothetical protein
MKTVLLIDAGYLRKISYKYNRGCQYNQEYIKKCIDDLKDDSLIRALYYDCPRFSGTLILPISKTEKVFESNNFLDILAQEEFLAIRRGKLKFRGFILKKNTDLKKELNDDDFEPVFMQKGVDMRIGLDIMTYSNDRLVDKIILITNDTDCIPAIKHARKCGISVSLVKYNNVNISPEILEHIDRIEKQTLPSCN